MVAIADIKDRKSLEAWLYEQPAPTRQNFATAIAIRATLRVATRWAWYFGSAKSKRDAPEYVLALLRVTLTASVAPVAPADTVKGAARAAAASTTFFTAFAIADNAADSAAPFSAAATRAAAAARAATAARAAVTFDDSAFFVASAVFDTADSTARAAARAVSGRAVADIRRAADRSSAAFWTLTRYDCEKGAVAGVPALVRCPLWTDDMPEPEVLAQSWRDLQAALSTDPADWSFWTTFLDAMRSGHGHRWKLWEEVATSDEIDWQAGPVAVNAKINEIVAQYAARGADGEREVPDSLITPAVKARVTQMLRAGPLSIRMSGDAASGMESVLQRLKDLYPAQNNLPEALEPFENATSAMRTINRLLSEKGRDQERIQDLIKENAYLKGQIAALRQNLGKVENRNLRRELLIAIAAALIGGSATGIATVGTTRAADQFVGGATYVCRDVADKAELDFIEDTVSEAMSDPKVQAEAMRLVSNPQSPVKN